MSAGCADDRTVRFADAAGALDYDVIYTRAPVLQTPQSQGWLYFAEQRDIGRWRAVHFFRRLDHASTPPVANGIPSTSSNIEAGYSNDEPHWHAGESRRFRC